MTYVPANLHDALETLPQMPSWITQARPESLTDVAFMSGAALSHLHHILNCSGVPLALLRARLALQAAEACVALSGRSERGSELRDELHLLRPGDQPGPAGATLLCWQRAVARPVSVGTLAKALPQIPGEEIGDFLDTEHLSGQGDPIARVATVLERVLISYPQDEVMAAILADTVLAQAFGWDHIVPLLSVGLKPGDWRKRGDDLRLACHRAVVSSVYELLPLAVDLTRRAARLQAVAPKLRAKGAGTAVQMFLTHDAVTPAKLSAPAGGTGLSDRGARRFCERLVELGVACELTGRDTFRIYGI
ncbi:hypothetical protein ROA7450_03839 [Roseovarius albus]|uniref:DUF1403 family protein n=2 Tax=Roseovarius albus TaxID=1247867 RepID=A0A1X7A4B2_9RHOB|nr:hypothetical protein ROA7450_03839 [Roseovarius albus]